MLPLKRTGKHLGGLHPEGFASLSAWPPRCSPVLFPVTTRIIVRLSHPPEQLLKAAVPIFERTLQHKKALHNSGMIPRTLQGSSFLVTLYILLASVLRASVYLCQLFVAINPGEFPVLEDNCYLAVKLSGHTRGEQFQDSLYGYHQFYSSGRVTPTGACRCVRGS